MKIVVWLISKLSSSNDSGHTLLTAPLEAKLSVASYY